VSLERSSIWSRLSSLKGLSEAMSHSLRILGVGLMLGREHRLLLADNTFRAQMRSRNRMNGMLGGLLHRWATDVF